MPAEAFEDLWDTIRNDHPWRGIVKNRCKNGDFYWVDAYVTAIKENGKITGYMSVRSCPSRKQIESAETLYKKVREGTATIPKTFKRPSPLRSILLQTGLMSSLVMLILLWLGWMNFSDTQPASPTVAILIGTGLALTATSILRWHQMLNRFINNANDAIEQIAEGKLSTQVHLCGANEFDQVLVNMDSMRINMRAIIAGIMYSTKTIDDISVWLKREIAELTHRSETQAQRAIQVTGSTENISLTTADISNNTDETANAAAQARQVVQESQAQVEQSIDSSARVVQVVDNLRASLQILNQSIDEIGSISAIISGIAGQTNLLALNAAIEAARAGEQGRGFAVVADEVRKLAERTTSSATDIGRIVASVHEATETSISSMSQVSSEVEQGSKIVQSTREQLEETLAAIRRTADMASVNADMLKQQMSATTDVAHHMEEIRTLVEANVFSVRGVESISINLLLGTADEQRTLVQHFEIH